MRLFIEKYYYILCLLIIIISRLFTSIYYIEDPDSLRFALGIKDFDITKFQPHFPVYPIFIFFTKVLYFITGGMAISFSLMGSIATFLIYYFIDDKYFKQKNLYSRFIFFILLSFSPLIWVMSTRYMPDLFGVASLFLSAFFLLKNNSKQQAIGFLFAGMLCGVRLSYLPFLFPIFIWLFFFKKRWKESLLFPVGILIWLIPLILISGWSELIEMAQYQTDGHFNKFGGSVNTDSNLLLRAIATVRCLWADGLGGYWNNRHFLTLLTSLLCILPLFKIQRSDFKNVSAEVKVLWACHICYLIWIFLGQNVIYKSRHILPIIPGTIALLFFLAHRYSFKKSYLLVFSICITVTLFINTQISIQHKQPTAVFKLKQKLDTLPPGNVVAVPLICYYLERQQPDRQNGHMFFPLEDLSHSKQLLSTMEDKPLYSIGIVLPDQELKMQDSFFHNPFVNRMWPAMHLYEYR